MIAERVSDETKMNPIITEREYRAFQHAYNFFNAELFDKSLPQILVTLQRHARAKGYFAPERFADRVEKVTAHELAFNPDMFTGRSDELILSTLVREIVHLGQQTHGTSPLRLHSNGLLQLPRRKHAARQPKTPAGVRKAFHHYGISQCRWLDLIGPITVAVQYSQA